MGSTSKLKILCTIADLPMDRLKEIGTVVQWLKPGYPTREEFLDLVKDCDALYCHGPEKIDKELFDKAPKLRVIGTYSVGYNHIDLEECKKRNVKVGYCAGETTEAASEMGATLLLATARRIPEAMELSKHSTKLKWHVYLNCGRQITGTTIGFFGLGAIGTRTMEKLTPFRPAKFIYHNRTKKDDCQAEYVSFDKLLRESDFLVITAALNEETKGKFNKATFLMMKKDAILVNISRGALVNTMDLYESLKSGHLAGAGLDVSDPEPLPENHPLLKLNNCIITPHLATTTYRTRERMNDLTISNIIAGLTGKSMPVPLVE